MGQEKRKHGKEERRRGWEGGAESARIWSETLLDEACAQLRMVRHRSKRVSGAGDGWMWEGLESGRIARDNGRPSCWRSHRLHDRLMGRLGLCQLHRSVRCPGRHCRLLRWKRASNSMRMWAFTRDTTCNTALTNMSMACYRQTLSAQLLSSAAYSRSLHLHNHASPQVLPDCKRSFSDPHRGPSTVLPVKLNDVRHSQATSFPVCVLRLCVKPQAILHVHRKRQETTHGSLGRCNHFCLNRNTNGRIVII